MRALHLQLHGSRATQAHCGQKGCHLQCLQGVVRALGSRLSSQPSGNCSAWPLQQMGTPPTVGWDWAEARRSCPGLVLQRLTACKASVPGKRPGHAGSILPVISEHLLEQEPPPVMLHGLWLNENAPFTETSWSPLKCSTFCFYTSVRHGDSQTFIRVLLANQKCLLSPGPGWG